MEDNSNLQDESQQASGAVGVIYKITCLVNGKAYVGQTRQSLNIRIGQHKRDSRRSRPGIDAAIGKYGWSDETFKVEVLEMCPVKMINEREMFHIRELKSKAPNGYNLTDGGDGGRGLSPSEETRAKISAKLKGRPAHNKGVSPSAEARAKISAHHKAAGIKPPNHKGKKRGPRSPETKAKLSLANKGKHPSKETLAKRSASLKVAWARRKKALEHVGDK